jgi:hypothetical protein
MLIKKVAPGWFREWWLIIVGLACLYLPMYYKLGTTLWITDEYTQGPMALAIVLFLLWHKRACFAAAPSQEPVADSGLAGYPAGDPPLRNSTRWTSITVRVGLSSWAGRSVPLRLRRSADGSDSGWPTSLRRLTRRCL